MSGYDEAVAWFRADPERVRDLDDVDNRSAAIGIVNAVLAEAVPAGRDLTPKDVRDALATVGTFPCSGLDRVAEHLSRIARPSGRDLNAAIAHYREHPESLDLLADPRRFPHAATIVRAVLARPAAGRDLTAQDVRDAVIVSPSGNEVDWRKVVHILNGIARPSGGAGQPDTAGERYEAIWHAAHRAFDLDNTLTDIEFAEGYGESIQFAQDMVDRFAAGSVSPDDAPTTETHTEYRVTATAPEIDPPVSDTYRDRASAQAKAQRWTSLRYPGVRVESRTVSTTTRTTAWKAEQ